MLYRNRSTLVAVALTSTLIGCISEPPVSFKAAVKPLIDDNCSECHLEGGEGAEESGFRVDSYEDIMKGTKYGPVVIPGDALSSTLYRLIAGKVDPSIQMPHGKESLAATQISAVENWILQGAKNN